MPVTRTLRGSLAIGASIVLLALWASAATAQDAAKVQITTVKVTDGLYVLAGSGGNIGVSVGEQGVLLTDDGIPGLVNPALTAPFVEKITTAVAANPLADLYTGRRSYLKIENLTRYGYMDVKRERDSHK